MIKNYKFLFLLLFGLFVFLPKDTFAMSIDLYTDNYQRLGGCTNCDTYYHYFDNSSFAYNTLSVRIITDTDITQNGIYNLENTLQIYSQTPSSQPYFRDVAFVVGSTTQNKNLTYFKANGYASEILPGGGEGKHLNWGTQATFTANTNGRLTIWYYFNNYINIREFFISSFSVVNTGNTTNDAINNSANSIIINNNQNTQQIIQSNEQIKKEQEKTNEELGELNDKLTNNDISDSQSEANSFFDDFESDDFGLSDIITMPLSFIQGLSSSTCYSLNLPLPFVDTNVSLPCMTSIYQRYFGSFLTLYQTITTGIIAYWCCINIFRMVQGFKNPDSDEIEVMDL